MSYTTIYFENRPVYLTDDLEDLKVKRDELQKDKEVVYLEGISSYHLQSMPIEIAKPGIKKGIIVYKDLEELRNEFFKQFVLIKAGGGLVKNEKNEILFILRKNKWDLPKGKLDEGETIEECALREVKEETGLTNVALIKKIYTSYHAYVEKGTRILKESHWYEMRADSSQVLIPQTEEEISDIRWIAEDEIANCLNNSYANIIRLLEMVVRT